MTRRKALLGIGLAAATGVVVLAIVRGGEIGPSRHELVNRFPELWEADAGAVRAIRDQLPHPWVIELEGTPLATVLEEEGEDAPLALLRVVLERHAEEEFSIHSPAGSPFEEMGVGHKLVDWLAARSDPSLNSSLLRIVEDRAAPMIVRVEALRAVCWPGNDAVVERLTDLALATDRDLTFRRNLLLRLPSIDRPLPSRLRSLLVGQLDYLAAYALAKSGDSAADPVIQEARCAFSGDDFACSRLDELDVPAGGPVRSEVDRLESSDVMTAEGKHLDLLESILAIREVEFERRDAFHAKLDRITRAIAADIGQETDPERIIAILNRRLLSGWMGSNSSSFLPHLLLGWDGNCVGRCSLFLAVAQRLELPIHAVYAPRHVFLRWDGRGYRRNIEINEGGRPTEDSRYMSEEPGMNIAPESAARGVYLRRLTQREFLAGVIGNMAAEFNARGKPLQARVRAEQALELHPQNVVARCVAAEAIFLAGPGGEDVALGFCDEATRLNPLEITPRQLRMGILLDLGRFASALEECERILEILPAHPETVLDRATCLLRLGRPAEASRAIEAVEPGNDFGLKTRRARLRIAHVVLTRSSVGSCEWMKTSIAGEKELGDYLFFSGSLRLAAADAFLTATPNVPADPIEAERVLSGITSHNHEWRRLRVRALLLKGERDAARAAFQEVMKHEDVTREVRKLRREVHK